ncbi:MAG: hypothetical protein Q7R39_10600 [Dehalococcoidia bacterium]|nr:hypothetical protein [Dehalococcoidia bacterium]
MAKLEKKSKKVGSLAAQQLKNSKNPKAVNSVDASALSQMPDKGKDSAKKKNKK